MRFTKLLLGAGLVVASSFANANPLFKGVDLVSQAYIYDSLIQTEFDIDNHLQASLNEIANRSLEQVELVAANQFIANAVTYEQSEAQKAE